MELEIQPFNKNTEIINLKRLITHEENKTTAFKVKNENFLNKFIYIYEGGKANLSNEEWINVLDVAYVNNCGEKVIDFISNEIFERFKIPEIIKLLAHCSSYFVTVAAELLPQLIKYSPFLFLPINTISQLFESPRVCMPNQIELADFIISFFNNVGFQAVLFVHYIDPKKIPPSKRLQMQNIFKKNRCDHLFPDFQINIVSNYSKYDSLKCTIENSKNHASTQKLTRINSNIQELNQKNAELELEVNKFQKNVDERIKERKELHDQIKNYEEYQSKFKESLDKIAKMKEDGDQCAQEIKQNDDYIKSVQREVDLYSNNTKYQYFSNEFNNFLKEMEYSIDKVNEDNIKQQEKLELLESNNKKLTFYLNQIKQYKKHIKKLTDYNAKHSKTGSNKHSK